MRFIFTKGVVFWWFILVLSLSALLIIAIAALAADTSNQSGLALWLRSQLSNTSIYSQIIETGALATNDAISGVVIGLLSGIFTLSFIYIYKIPDIRRISIQILAAGYYENFLHKVIQKVHSEIGSDGNSVIIVLPGFALVEHKEIYWKSFQSMVQSQGFRFVQETTDSDFGRNIFAIQRADLEQIPVFIDMPTTLTNLKKIIELETHSPVGTVSSRNSIKKRFYKLRDQFEKELRMYVREHDWGNIRFVEGRSIRAFEDELQSILNSLAPQPPQNDDGEDITPPD